MKNNISKFEFILTGLQRGTDYIRRRSCKRCHKLLRRKDVWSEWRHYKKRDRRHHEKALWQWGFSIHNLKKNDLKLSINFMFYYVDFSYSMYYKQEVNYTCRIDEYQGYIFFFDLEKITSWWIALYYIRLAKQIKLGQIIGKVVWGKF